MSSSEFGDRAGNQPRATDSPVNQAELIDRLKRLAARPRGDGYPIDWLVEAYHLGDLSALATLSFRGINE